MHSTLTILHPGIEGTRETKPRLAARPASLQGARLALLDNGKVNAGALLAAVAARLQALGVAEVRAWKKQHAGQSGEKLIPEILQWRPDVALTALGD